MKENPTQFDYKILVPDDAFIGLDASNRYPVLNILKEEFKDYQIFITTYDRHWYELAKRKFENEQTNKWRFIELYTGIIHSNGSTFEAPIVVTGETNFERGTYYLHHQIRPDYPASANYFRKALEELIKDFIPKWETVDAENTQLPDFQLTSLILRAKRFFYNADISLEFIDNISSLTSTLLHPLSHHQISSPVYRGELVIFEENFIKLREQLINLEISNNFKCCIEEGKC